MLMQGHTILVAGGCRGIGRGLAALLGRLGNEVLVFDAEPGAAQAAARSHPGLRAVALDLADPWSVAGFAEQVAAECPELNLLVDIDIGFPVRHLPGMQALLEDDDGDVKQEARRLGLQHLTGALLPHLRKRSQSAVFTLRAGPQRLPPQARPARGLEMSDLDGGASASSLSVRKRWASASIDVVDVTLPSRAERMAPVARDHGLSRADFISDVAHLLAEGLQEAQALARLESMWPRVQATVRHTRTRDDDVATEAF